MSTLIKNKYVFRGKDITDTIIAQIMSVINILREEDNLTFMEAMEMFYTSNTHRAFVELDCLLWAESQHYIVDTLREYH